MKGMGRMIMSLVNHRDGAQSCTIYYSIYHTYLRPFRGLLLLFVLSEFVQNAQRK